MMLIFHGVFAADLSTYARQAPVVLPAQGTVRVAVPPELVGAHPEALDGNLRLVDGAQSPVQYAVLRSSTGGTQERNELDLSPEDLDHWLTEYTDAPTDAVILAVTPNDGPFYATVSWAANGQWIAAPRTLMYGDDGEDGRTLAVPHVQGPFRVHIEGIDSRRRLIDVTAVRDAPDFVPFVEETVAVSEPTLREDGTARYVLKLGGERYVRALRFEIPASEGILNRQVTVRTPDNPYGSAGVIRRIRVGDTNVERVTISVENVASDTLFVDVQRDRELPLPIEEIDVLSEGAFLVVTDAGAGPHTLYTDGTEPEPAHDLAVALPDLLRSPTPVVPLGGVEPNPVYVAEPTREGVDDPGPDLALGRFRYERPIEGSGWSRVSIGREVLAHARPDLGDVRVVDATGRQVPFLLWDRGEEELWPVSDFTREEVGSQTRIRVPLEGDAPVARLELRTSKGVFSRNVSILRDLGRSTVSIRFVTWNGPDQGSVLSLDLNERMGDALLVTIDNGDDPPIPIDSVAITTRVWELRTKLPEGGARLVYGAAGASAPSYDLDLLRTEVRAMQLADATLGDERALSAPVPGLVDRGATLLGVAMLALGLLGVLLRVLLGAIGGATPPAESEPQSPAV
jgi:hypothetical protein